MLQYAPMRTVAFIDGANLHKGIEQLGWELDYQRFHVWLVDKFKIEKAYLFLGLIPEYTRLYKKLQEAGYVLVFKETISDHTGKVKGNCDAELVLQTVSGWYEKQFDDAVVVSGDGDFRCLVDFLIERSALKRILAPDNKKCSVLLKRTGAKITFIIDHKNFVGRNEKAPDTDRTVQGSLSW